MAIKVNAARAVGGMGAGGVILAAAMLALPDLRLWEGLRTKPYLDIVQVQTVCFGETRVEMREYTVAECEEMAINALSKDFGPAVVACVPGLADENRKHQLASAMLLAYNIGKPGFCGSSAACAFNGGIRFQVSASPNRYVCRIRHTPATISDWKRGCNAYMPWNKGTFKRPPSGSQCIRKRDGKWLCEIRGLTNRRKHERDLCLTGL